MLAEFREVHEALRTALDRLDALTRAESPDEAAVATTRVNLGRASARRRKLFDAAFNTLIATAGPADARRLRDLRDLNAAQLQASTAHIGKWGLRELLADWPGYVSTSAAMRQSMRDLMAGDRAVLFPMLERGG